MQTYAVVWHESDHAEGEIFSDHAAAQLKYDQVDGGNWAGRLYYYLKTADTNLAVLQQYGSMSAQDWEMLDIWTRDRLMPVSPTPTSVTSLTQAGSLFQISLTHLLLINGDPALTTLPHHSHMSRLVTHSHTIRAQSIIGDSVILLRPMLTIMCKIPTGTQQATLFLVSSSSWELRLSKCRNRCWIGRCEWRVSIL